ARNKAELDEEHLALPTEVTDDVWQVVSHQREVALAQGHAVDRAGYEVQQALVVLHAAHDSAHAANWRQWWIIRMHRQLDIRLLGHRHDPLEKIFEVGPELRIADRAELCRRGIP